MVVSKDFDVQIVSAEDDRMTPFKEHKKGLQSYVEVEPEAEYYISVRGASRSARKRAYKIYVDGKSLNYTAFGGSVNSRRLNGIRSLSKGISTHTALKFAKASFRNDNNASSPGVVGMGEIEVKVYERIETRSQRLREEDSVCIPFTLSSIPSNDCSKKNLRSEKGSHEIQRSKRNRFTTNGTGAFLYSIVLKYCATPGLIAVGVLPKPPFWIYNRMLHPAICADDENESTSNYVVSVKRNRKGNEILVIKDDESDDDVSIKSPNVAEVNREQASERSAKRRKA